MDTQKENPDKLPENSTDKDQLAVADDVPLSWESATADVADEIEEVAEVVVKGTVELQSKMIQTDELINTNAGSAVTSDDDSVLEGNTFQHQTYVDEPQQDTIDKS